MLVSLRMNLWSLRGTSVVLRDTEARLLDADGRDEARFRLHTWPQLAAFVSERFGPRMLHELERAAPMLLAYVDRWNAESDLRRVLAASQETDA